MANSHSETMKALWRTSVYRQRQKISQSVAMGKRWKDPRFRRIMSGRDFQKAAEASARRWEEPKFRRKATKRLRECSVRNWKNPKFRNMMIRAQSRSMRERMKDPEFVQKIHKSHVSPSRPQLSIFRQLCRAGVRGFRLEYPVGIYSLDIANPRKKIGIEVDGNYWHGENRKNKRKRSLCLRSLGWKILRVPAARSSGRKLIRMLT